MANEELRIWGIHTTDDALFLHDNVIAIGWKHYDQLGDKYRKMIPLKMVYIPIPEEE